MTLYILDTDHLSLYGRNHPILIDRLLKSKTPLTTTAITVEEQVRGRLAQLSQAKDESTRSIIYQRLVETVMLLSEFTILLYDQKSLEIYQTLKSQRLRVGTQDLRIASITIANQGILLTRNLQDFAKIPGLTVEDWSIQPRQ
jgi:tRNA(fMet)-specific endonuclease VapC